MPTQPSKSTRLTERIRRYVSHDRLLLMRNFSYGGSAFCLVILVGLTQIGAKDSALIASVYSVSIALPFWILIGGIYEFYIFLGKPSYPHLRTKFFTNMVSVSLTIACLAMFVATGSIIWFLLPEATFVFGASSLVAFVFAIFFQIHLARWWFRDGGPGEKDDDI